MKKFLWFNMKEPYEKIVDKILKAKEEKTKIEFSDSYLRSMLNEKQAQKFIKWVEDNKDWIENKMSQENELERLQRQMPLGCTLELNVNIQLKTFYIFDFR